MSSKGRGRGRGRGRGKGGSSREESIKLTDK